jgi:hypothetical protein
MIKQKLFGRKNRGLTEVLFWHFPGGTEEIYEELQSG